MISPIESDHLDAVFCAQIYAFMREICKMKEYRGSQLCPSICPHISYPYLTDFDEVRSGAEVA
jgi:hypothetical protein